MCCNHNYSSRNIFAVRTFSMSTKLACQNQVKIKEKDKKKLFSARVSECPSHDFVSVSVQALTDDFPGLSLQQQVKRNAL